MGALQQALLMYGAVGGGGGSLNPGSYLTGLDWYLDPDNVSGVDGDPVTILNDASGAGANYGQGGLASSTRPTLKKNIINGHAVVRFGGTHKLVNDPNAR